MKTKNIHLLFSAIFALTLLLTGLLKPGATNYLPENKQFSDDRIYELRTYTTHPDKLDDLHQRFRDHTIRIFAKHNMISIAYWVPDDPELKENTLIYVLSHESREAAEQSWENFLNDPEWQEVYDASHADGPIVSNVESVFMKATPYSQIR